MEMRNAKFNYRKFVTLCAVLAIVALQSVANSTSAGLRANATPEADVSAEGRILDSFADALAALEKKQIELGKKATLTRAEFDAHQRNANDLRNRVSAVQNALQEIIRKLKAAGQWDNLDSLVLAKISDSRFQDFARREGFKRILEAAATGLSTDANEITNPLDSLRNKIRAQAQDLRFAPDQSPMALRAIPVAYAPANTAFAVSFKCRVGWLRFGVTKAILGHPSQTSTNQVNCSCMGDQASCDAL
jgi:uncharacterized protein YukE